MSDTQPIWYEFRSAVYAGDFQHAENMLANNPELISLENGLGETALHFLAVENDQEGVAWLFSKGSHLDVRNRFGDPAIFEVASLGYKELLLWFRQNGANFGIKGRKGESLLEYLLAREEKEMVEWVRKIAT